MMEDLFHEILNETTADTLARKTINKGRVLSKENARKMMVFIASLPEDKSEHLRKITRWPAYFDSASKKMIKKRKGLIDRILNL